MPVVEVTHPLVRHKLGLLRDAATGPALFRQVSAEIATLLAYEATTDLALGDRAIDTWAGFAEQQDAFVARQCGAGQRFEIAVAQRPVGRIGHRLDPRESRGPRRVGESGEQLRGAVEAGQDDQRGHGAQPIRRDRVRDARVRRGAGTW